MKKMNRFFVILAVIGILILWGLFSMMFVYCPAYYEVTPEYRGVSLENEPFKFQFFLDDENEFCIGLISPKVWIPTHEDSEVCLKNVEMKLKRSGSPSQVIPISYSRDSLSKCNLPKNFIYTQKKDIDKQWSTIETAQVCFENIVAKQYIFYITCNYYYKNKTYSKTEKFTLTRKGGGYELISKISFGRL